MSSVSRTRGFETDTTGEKDLVVKKSKGGPVVEVQEILRVVPSGTVERFLPNRGVDTRVVRYLNPT